MKTRAWVAVLSIAMHDAFASTPADYAYVLPIEAPAAESSAWRVDLTPEVYAWVQDDSLGDVEVFNAAGKPVPAMRWSRPRPVAISLRQIDVPVLMLPAEADKAANLRLSIVRDADGRLRRIDSDENATATPTSRDWLIDTSTVDAAMMDFKLDWDEPTSGIVARFAIDASDDLQHWHNTGTVTATLLEQNGASVERRTFPLGEIRTNFLRLRRLDDGPDLKGLRARVRTQAPAEARPAAVWLDAESIDAPTDAPHNDTTSHFYYRLPAALPIDLVHIELADDNALAALTLYARATTTSDWQLAGKLDAFRLREDGDTLRNGDIAMRPSNRYRELRLDTDTPLASEPKLSVSVRPASFVFLAEGQAPYTLAVGSLTHRRADYPIDAALASLRTKLGRDWQPPPATLGAARPSAGPDVLRPSPPPFPWRIWLLWGILVGGAVLIAVFALSLVRGSKSQP